MVNEKRVITNRDMERMGWEGSCDLGFCQYSLHPYFMMNNIIGFIILITQDVSKRPNQLQMLYL
jgi:hypothetical protein